MIYIYEYKKKESKTKKIYIYIINIYEITQNVHVLHMTGIINEMQGANHAERKGGREWEGVSVTVRKRDEISNDFFFLFVIPYPVPCEKTSFAIEL